MNKNTLEILWRRRVAVLAVLGLGLVIVLLGHRSVPKSYEATASVLMVNENLGRDPSLLALDMPTLVQSTTVLSQVKKHLHLDASIPEIQSAISAKVDINSNVMPISYRARNADGAVAVANGLADELAAYYRHILTDRYTGLTLYLTRERSLQRSRIETLNHRLESGLAHAPFTGSNAALETLSARLVDLQTSRNQAAGTMVGDDAELSARNAQSASAATIAHQESLQSDPLFKTLRDEQAKDAANLAIQKAQYSSRYPGLPGLRRKVEREQSAVKQEERTAFSHSPLESPFYVTSLLERNKVQANLEADRARVAAIDSQIASIQSGLKNGPAEGISVATLRMERDSAESAYQALSTRIDTTRANQAEAASLGSVVVIDRAHRAQLFLSKQAGFVTVFGVIAITAIAIAFAFLLEMLDSRLRSAERIEKLYGRPVIASV